MSLNPPVKENNFIDCWFRAIYTLRKKEYFYIGKLKKRFLEDKGVVSSIESDS